MTSLTRPPKRLPENWCADAYKRHIWTLFDPPIDSLNYLRLDSEKKRKYYAGVLARLEAFIDAIIDDQTLDRPNFDQKRSKLSKYYSWVPEFLRVVSMLSDLYTYNEHVNVFIACSKGMKLLDENINWGLLNSADGKTREANSCFFELARMIRKECLSSKIRLAVSKRRHEAQRRFDDYCDYISLCFEKHAKLIFLRIDLYYQSSIAPQISAEQAVADLDRLLSNTRHNQIFKGWVGYIAKLEYGAQKRLHWHLIVILNGHIRKGSSHIDACKNIGKYWKTQVTKETGTYWNCNENAKDFDQRNICGIGEIHYSDIQRRMNLELNVLSYLTKTTQLFRPKFGLQVKTIRRGQPPKVTGGSKRGRKRARFECYMAHINRDDQPGTLTTPTYPKELPQETNAPQT